MQRAYRAPLRFAVYAVLLLLAVVVQTLPLSLRVPVCAVPCAVTCVAMQEGAERGGLIALLAALAWGLLRGDPLSILTLTLCGVGAGLLCERLLARGVLPCLALCALALVVCQGAGCLWQLFYHNLAPAVAQRLLWREIVFALPCAPVCWALCRFAGRVGGL